ncbi:barstar family protein [Sinomicrobium sp.]
MTELQLTIRGELIDDIPSFYDEINQVFMVGENWKLGHSLDALNDMLYGGFGVMKDFEKVTVTWTGLTHSKHALGIETTRNYYLEKLKHPKVFEREWVQHKLDALNKGQGKTFFQIVLDIFRDHTNITLRTED